MSQLAVAYGVGMLALVSPCGFAMLPAFLAYNAAGSGTATRRGAPPKMSRALATGLGVSLGFALTFIAGGLLVSAGLRSITDAVPWFGVVVGVGLVGIGIAIASGKRFGMSFGANWFTKPGPVPSVTFGAAYALTQLACGMGSLLAVTATGMASSSFAGTAAVFVAFGVGSTSLLLLLAVSMALMGDALVRRVRAVAPLVTRVSGAVLALAGLYLVLYWTPALDGGGGADNAVSRIVHDASAASRAWLGDNELVVAALTALLLVIAGAAWL
ncbi:MAG: cytochrome c biogenesis protein CcdA, partial [Actinomycetota bacterium]|nr:cytochrome c biogenesis protein CcdA [Actinomycetota bacterium]